jgi:ABC-type nitrate/sulfonate/bicarbonate transport system substrate-binding protein
MKKVIFSLGVAVLLFSGCANKTVSPQAPGEDLTKVRIGWQIPWATEGQLTQVLKHTNLLKENNLEGDFKGFSYGGPLNEAALAGEVDVLFTADQPAMMLMSKSDDWEIIGRLMYNRVSLYVPPKSEIEDVSGLAGKTVAMPFGAAAQRMALLEEKKAGLNPKTDVNNINLGIYEQSDLVNDKEAKTWGDVDALAGFDPTPAIFEEKGLVKNLAVGKIVSVIVMNKTYIKNNPEAPKNFLRAFRGAYEYYRDNVEQADAWFTEEAGLDITPEALAIAASVEPNLSGEEIRLDFSEDDYIIMEEAVNFLVEQEIMPKYINPRDVINLDYLYSL